MPGKAGEEGPSVWAVPLEWEDLEEFADCSFQPGPTGDYGYWGKKAVNGSAHFLSLSGCFSLFFCVSVPYKK